MEQQVIQTRFSIGSKLLIGLVSLLSILVIILDFSAIFIMKQDKQAYIFQAQSTEAQLVGRDIVDSVQKGVGTLKLALAAVVSDKKLTDNETTALDSLFKNQDHLLTLRFFSVPKSGGEVSLLYETSSEEKIQINRFTKTDFEISEKEWVSIFQEVKEKGIVLRGRHRQGRAPKVLIAVADIQLDGQNMPLVAGEFLLKELAAGLKLSLATIATERGDILFDSIPERLLQKDALKKDSIFQWVNSLKISEGAQEVTDENGDKYLASFFRPGFDLIVITRVEWKKAMRAMITLLEKLVLLGLAAVAMGIIFSIFFSKSIVGPLKKLTEATGMVASGNFNLSLQIDSQDEIGTLARSFNVMSKKIQELIKESIEKTRLESEIKVASTVQQTLFPPTEVRGDRFEIVSTYQSASECGGDWWGYFEARDKLYVFIGDATGHGIPSALITASARSCFSIMHKLAVEEDQFLATPGNLLAFANRAIHDSSHGKIMMTFFAGEFDFAEKKLKYAVAAHNPQWLFRAQGGTHKLVSLGIPGERLGEKSEVPPYEEKETEFESGDVLFLYTDGLVEGKSRSGEEYGKKRARKFAEDHVGKGPKVLVEKIMLDFKSHNGSKPFDDDVTLAAVRIK